MTASLEQEIFYTLTDKRTGKRISAIYSTEFPLPSLQFCLQVVVLTVLQFQ